MAHSLETRQKVKQKYIYERQSIALIASMMHVSEGTITRWKKDDKANASDWDRARAAASIGGGGKEELLAAVIEDFVILFKSSIDEIKAKSAADLSVTDKIKALTMLADSFSKTMSAAAKASPELNKLGVAQDVLQKLSDFIVDRFPQHGTAFLEILEPFGDVLAAEFE